MPACLLVVPGQERYGNMTRVYYREAVGALVVFDVTRASTFDAVLKWKDDLDSKVRRELSVLQSPHLWPTPGGETLILRLSLFVNVVVRIKQVKATVCTDTFFCLAV